MNCPHCNKEIPEADILSLAASIQGKRSKRKLSKKDARAMQAKSVAARKKNKRTI